MNPLEQNQRTFPRRIPRQIPVEVKGLYSRDSGEKAMTRNVGGGGMCLTLSGHYEPDTMVDLKFSIPRWQSNQTPLTSRSESILNIMGKVVWCRERSEDSGYDIGIEFRPRNFAEAKEIYAKLYPYFMLTPEH